MSTMSISLKVGVHSVHRPDLIFTTNYHISYQYVLSYIPIESTIIVIVNNLIETSLSQPGGVMMIVRPRITNGCM